MWKSSNPVLSNQDAFEQYYGSGMAADRPDVSTLSGVVNKTGILVLIAVLAGAGGYAVAQINMSVLMISWIVSLIVGIGVAIKISRKPASAPIVAPIYAVVEGFFLGAFTALADYILASQGLKAFGGVGLQAFIITMSAVLVMLGLYKAGILRPTQRFKAVIYTATGAIMVAYLISIVMSLFGASLPLISFSSAVSSHGLMGLIGLGVNVLILIVAALWLIIDFGTVEEIVAAQSPKYMEWFGAFALIVTLAWIYFEAVKLVLRLALLFGNRD